MIIKEKVDGEWIERSSCTCKGYGCDDCAENQWGYIRGITFG